MTGKPQGSCCLGQTCGSQDYLLSFLASKPFEAGWEDLATSQAKITFSSLIFVPLDSNLIKSVPYAAGGAVRMGVTISYPILRGSPVLNGMEAARMDGAKAAGDGE